MILGICSEIKFLIMILYLLAFEINYSDTTDFLSIAQVENKSNVFTTPVMPYSGMNDYKLRGH